MNVAEAKLHEINEKCYSANLQTFLETAKACHPEHQGDQVTDLEQKLHPANRQVQDFEEQYNTVIIIRSDVKLRKTALSKMIFNHLGLINL